MEIAILDVSLQSSCDNDGRGANGRGANGGGATGRGATGRGAAGRVVAEVSCVDKTGQVGTDRDNVRAGEADDGRVD